MSTNKSRDWGKAMTERRFSKTCGKCGRRAMALAQVDYAVDVAHDGRTYHVVVPGLELPRCGNCGTIVIDDAAERAIDLAFRRQAHLLTADEIKAGRKALDLEQTELASLLAVGPSTVSRWETGAQV